MSAASPYKRTVVFLHTVLIYAWTICSTILFGLLAILCSFFSSTGNSVHFVARLWGRGILWVSGVRVAISGMEHIEPGRSYIYMSNHQSNFDIPVLLSKLTVQFRWLAKAELFKIPIFGRGMRGAGYISIDRSNRKSAFQSLDRAAQSIRRGTSVLVFPEGTRTKDGSLIPFKKGGFVLAVDAGVQVIPVIIKGTYSIMPKNSLLVRRRAVEVVVKAPIDASAYTRKTKIDLMDAVRSVMLEELQTQVLQEA